MKIGMYTENEIFEYLTTGEGSMLGRSMYDAIFDKIHALITENQQLKEKLEATKEVATEHLKNEIKLKSTLEEIREYIRSCCNMDVKIVNLHFDNAQNEMSADQVDDLLQIIDKSLGE